MEQQKEKEIQFFNKFGKELDYDVFTPKGYKRIMDAFVSNINFSDKQSKIKMLDFGCGTGAFTNKFSEFPVELHGIDISPACIEYAQQKYPNINFVAGDVENTPYEDGSFDYVIMSGLLHHFPDFRKVAAEAKRVLKPGGKVLAYDPHRGNPIMWLYRCKDSPFYSNVGVTENEGPISIKLVKDTFTNLDYSKVEVTPVSGITYKYVEGSTARLFLSVYNLVENIFNIEFLRKRYGSFLITIAQK